jgi:hypothetical protein
VIPDDVRELFAVARDCGFPAVTVGRLTVVGERGWASALGGGSHPPAVSRERGILLRGLERPLLVCTPAGAIGCARG